MEPNCPTSHHFLHIPLELRQAIYSHVLPEGNTDTHGPGWIGPAFHPYNRKNIDQPPRGLTAILSTNRQVYEEAAAKFYGVGQHKCFIDGCGTGFLEQVVVSTEEGAKTNLITAAKFVKNWVVEIRRLCHVRPAREDATDDEVKAAITTDYEWERITRGIEACGTMLSTVQDLKTLRFRIPSHCYTRFSSWEKTATFWIEALEP
ncbi:MAG: hypothetical protein LQ352_002238, partial [Teloschistes flavicans]